MGRKNKNIKGFTLIEIMVVIIIIGILIVITLPNFVNSVKRAKVSSVKSNMHTLQTIVETYGADFSGNYPSDLNNLYIEASAKKYNKLLFNPFNNITGEVNNSGVCKTYTDVEYNSLNEYTEYTTFEGKTAYYGIKNGNFIQGYAIYGHEENGKIILYKDKVLVLSNS